jgi:hypothetical protein
MRVLLLSTYELGAQPLGLAVPAAVLGAAGHVTRSRDISLEPLTDGDIAWAQAACVSVPMHTALRLAAPLVARLRGAGVPVALHGLYAPVGATAGLLGTGDLAVAGEAAGELLAWLRGLAVRRTEPPRVAVSLGPPRPSTVVPERRALPGLERYARLTGGPAGDGERLVATLEATSGCSHRCRHCPVPVVYAGRTRPVAVEALLADLDQLVAAGAGHVHFADPDFLNRPAHSLGVVRALHERHPDLSWDATVKVSHVLRHRDLWPELAATGCAFVISAVESLSPVVLERLDKGHSAADAGEAVAVLRGAGIEPRPSLLPFTPWTTRDDLVELLDFVAAHDLVWNMDPVQWGIRLLLPPGSLLLAEPDPVLADALARAASAISAHAPGAGAASAHAPGAGAAHAASAAADGAGDDWAEALGRRWAHADPLLDELQLELAELVEKAEAAAGTAGEADRCGGSGAGSPAETYDAVRRTVFKALGRADPGAPEPLARARSAVRGPRRARLTEAWFCCAEPTGAQLARTVSPCPPVPPASQAATPGVC